MSILNYLVYEKNHTIPFIPVLSWLCEGNDTAALFLHKAIHFAQGKQGDPFYKFTAPPEKANVYYRPGDSWVETFYIGKKKFETARDLVCTKVGRGDSKKDIAEAGVLASLFFFWTGRENVTYYELNIPFAEVVFDELFNYNFDHDGRPLRTLEEFWEAVNERKEEFKYVPKATFKEVEATNSKALVKKTGASVEIDGKTYGATMIKATAADYTYPRLNVKIPMYDSFEPTPEQVAYAKSIGYSDEEITAFTARQVNWFLNKKSDKRPGWWGTWHTNLLGDYAKRKGGYNAKSRPSASAKRVETFRSLDDDSLYANIKD